MDSLSPRQREMIERVCNDMCTSEAAYDLGIDINTAKTHLTVAYLRLQVKSRAAACRIYGAFLERNGYTYVEGELVQIQGLRADTV